MNLGKTIPLRLNCSLRDINLEHTKSGGIGDICTVNEAGTIQECRFEVTGEVADGEEP